MRRYCEAGTSATTAAVSVADAAYARSAEGLQSAEEANSYHVSQQAYARSAEGLRPAGTLRIRGK